MKKNYTINDFTVRKLNRQVIDDNIIAHTHDVRFSRKLTDYEKIRFERMLVGLHDVVYFSERFGTRFPHQPKVTFLSNDHAEYVLYHRDMAGEWKDLLFGMLATFSYEIVPIVLHDDNPIFDPERRADSVEFATAA